MDKLLLLVSSLFLLMGCGQNWEIATTYGAKYSESSKVDQAKVEEFRLQIATLWTDDIVSIQQDSGEILDYIVRRNIGLSSVIELTRSPNGTGGVLHVPYNSLSHAVYWSERITFIHRKDEVGWEETAKHFFLNG